MQSKNRRKPKNSELAYLPPTADSLGQHLKRVYFQVREWIGSILGQPNSLNPEEWGWCKVGNTFLQPVKMMQPFAPEKVLNIVFCHCKTGCGVLCGCRKSDIECTSISTNPDEEVVDEEDEEDVQGEEVIQGEDCEESAEAAEMTASDYSDDEEYE